MDLPRALAELSALHADVDRAALGVAAQHLERLQCRRGCAQCCVDGITVFPVEAARIQGEHGELLDRGAPGPEGACAFLDAAGGCRIYGARPYVCRTQGLPLRWIEVDEAGRGVELRDVCPLNDPPDAPPLEGLDPEACWTIGPFEERLAALQIALDGRPDLQRVALRDLFGSPRPPGG